MYGKHPKHKILLYFAELFTVTQHTDQIRKTGLVIAIPIVIYFYDINN